MSGERASSEMFGPDALGIPNGYWANVMESIGNEGYITGAVCTSNLVGAPNITLSDPKITQKGIEFLQENPLYTESEKLVEYGQR